MVELARLYFPNRSGLKHMGNSDSNWWEMSGRYCSSHDRPFLQRHCNRRLATITTGAANPNGSFKEHITDRTLLRVILDANVAKTFSPKRSLLPFQTTPGTRSVKSGFRSKQALWDRSTAGVLARTLRLFW